MSNDQVGPSSIEGIKQLARRLKKANGLKHSVALDLASKAAGCENFKHALRSLGAGLKPPRVAHEIYISVPWRDRATKATGREVLKMLATKPLDALASPAQYKAARGLITMRRAASDHIADTYIASSKLRARSAACAAARTLQFIDVTSLVPSTAKRSFPRGDYQNRMPGSDHDTAWFDPAAKTYIRSNEPYSQADVTAQQLRWAAQHGWTVTAAPWKGMYNPDGGTSLFLSVDASKGYSLDPISSKLAQASAPIVVADWNGESMPFCQNLSARAAWPRPRQKRLLRSPSDLARPTTLLNIVCFRLVQAAGLKHGCRLSSTRLLDGF